MDGQGPDLYANSAKKRPEASKKHNFGGSPSKVPQEELIDLKIGQQAAFGASNLMSPKETKKVSSSAKKGASRGPDSRSSVSMTEAELKKLKSIRENMAIETANAEKAHLAARASISRASEQFSLSEGVQAGDLIIENERLKATI